MQVSYEQKDHVCVVALRGNLALDKVPEARKALKPVLEGSKADSALLVDMQKVKFIDSSGIGLVVSLFKVMQERKGQFGLSGLSRKNKEIFSMTRLDRIMDLYTNEAAALKGLKAPNAKGVKAPNAKSVKAPNAKSVKAPNAKSVKAPKTAKKK